MTIEQRKKRINQLRINYHRIMSRKKFGLCGTHRGWIKNIDTALSIHLGKLEQAGVYGY